MSSLEVPLCLVSVFALFPLKMASKKCIFFSSMSPTLSVYVFKSIVEISEKHLSIAKKSLSIQCKRSLHCSGYIK